MKNPVSSKQKTVSRGFTLVETLVAITILTLAVSGSFMTANNAMIAAQTARDQLIASHLAQEGIEYMRMMRDDYYLNGHANGTREEYYQACVKPNDGGDNAWNDFFNTVLPCRGANSCTLDPTQLMGIGSSLQQCSGACTNTPLYLTSTLPSIYTQQSSGNMKTVFTRAIQIRDIAGGGPNCPFPDEKIISTVSWIFHGTTHTVTITDHLTPWQ